MESLPNRQTMWQKNEAFLTSRRLGILPSNPGKAHFWAQVCLIVRDARFTTLGLMELCRPVKTFFLRMHHFPFNGTIPFSQQVVGPEPHETWIFEFLVLILVHLLLMQMVITWVVTHLNLSNFAAQVLFNSNLPYALPAGTTPFMKWIGFGSTVSNIQFDTQSSTSFGHPNGQFTAGVGAAWSVNTPEFGVSPPELESFSSRGGTPILFDRSGARLAAPEIRNQPRFVATDGCINTFFGDFLDASFGLPNGAGYYFFGRVLR
jgi:hypothetical protein